MFTEFCLRVWERLLGTVITIICVLKIDCWNTWSMEDLKTSRFTPLFTPSLIMHEYCHREDVEVVGAGSLEQDCTQACLDQATASFQAHLAWEWGYSPDQLYFEYDSTSVLQSWFLLCSLSWIQLAVTDHPFVSLCLCMHHLLTHTGWW